MERSGARGPDYLRVNVIGRGQLMSNLRWVTGEQVSGRTTSTSTYTLDLNPLSDNLPVLPPLSAPIAIPPRDPSERPRQHAQLGTSSFHYPFTDPSVVAPYPAAPDSISLVLGSPHRRPTDSDALARKRVASAPMAFLSTSPSSPLANYSSSPDPKWSSPRRRSAQFPPPGSPSSPIPTSSPFLAPAERRRRRSSVSLSTSGGSAPPFGSFVGSFEQSLMSGRLSALPSLPLPFLLSIGVLGGPGSSSRLRCPPHLNLPLEAFYYTGPDGAKSSSPYVGTVDLEEHYLSSLRGSCEGSLDDRGNASSSSSVPRFPGYQVPVKGQVQLVIKNPNSTAVKLFLIPYDLTGLDRCGHGGKTFLRQKSYTIDESGDETKGRLRYAVHLQFCCPPAGKAEDRLDDSIKTASVPRYYLHGNVRVVFASRALDTSEKLRVVAEGPEGVLNNDVPRSNSATDPMERFAAYPGPGKEWEMARRKVKEREKARRLTRASPLHSAPTTTQHAQQGDSEPSLNQMPPVIDPNGVLPESSPSPSALPHKDSVSFSDLASVALAAPFSFTGVSHALPIASSPSPSAGGKRSTDGLPKSPLSFERSASPAPPLLKDRTSSMSGLSTTRPPSREEDCGR